MWGVWARWRFIIFWKGWLWVCHPALSHIGEQHTADNGGLLGPGISIQLRPGTFPGITLLYKRVEYEAVLWVSHWVQRAIWLEHNPGNMEGKGRSSSLSK